MAQNFSDRMSIDKTVHGNPPIIAIDSMRPTHTHGKLDSFSKKICNYFLTIHNRSATINFWKRHTWKSRQKLSMDFVTLKNGNTPTFLGVPSFWKPPHRLVPFYDRTILMHHKCVNLSSLHCLIKANSKVCQGKTTCEGVIKSSKSVSWRTPLKLDAILIFCECKILHGFTQCNF